MPIEVRNCDGAKSGIWCPSPPPSSLISTLDISRGHPLLIPLTVFHALLQSLSGIKSHIRQSIGRLYFLMLILQKGNFVCQPKYKENLAEPSGLGLPAQPEVIPRTLPSDCMSTMLIELVTSMYSYSMYGTFIG